MCVCVYVCMCMCMYVLRGINYSDRSSSSSSSNYSDCASISILIQYTNYFAMKFLRKIFI